MKRKGTNYQRGAYVERKAIELLRERGYDKRLTFRSAGSHSDADVVGIDTDAKRIFIGQCKRSKDGKFPRVDLPRDGTYLVEFRVLNWCDGEGFVLELDGDGEAVD